MNYKPGTYLYVKADTNDGDYISELTEITEAEIETIKPVVAAIKDFKPYKTKWEITRERTHYHNFPTNDQVREDLGEKTVEKYYGEQGVDLHALEVFQDYVPSHEYGIHTIESVQIIEITKTQKLL